MTLVSIDIGAMESLIADLRSATGDLPSAATTVRGRLDYVRLSTASVASVVPGQPVWTWMEDRLRDLNRRLTLARIIAASTPGFDGVGVVEIDESIISNLSDAELRSLVDEIEVLMATEPGERIDVDERLVEILQEHAHDPYFAKILAEQISPQELDWYLRSINEYRQFDLVGDSAGVQAFDERYNGLLNGLGMAFGLASQGEGGLEVPGMQDAWTDHLEALTQGRADSGVHRLALVISRGAFSTDFLTGVHSVLADYEGDRGAAAWTMGDFVFDPDPSLSPGSNLLMDPMGALFQALGANPEALRQIFGTGDTTTIETDDGPVEVNADLWHALRVRGTDEYGIQQLIMGLQTGVTSMPIEGQDAWQPVMSEELTNIVNAIEREARIAEENAPPWYATVGHVLLDIVGLVPGLGEWADGLNAAWYLAEGNTTDAALSAAGAVPFVGWFAVGGKWVRRAFTPEELLGLERAAGNGADLSRMLPGGRLARHADDLADPDNFTPGSFLSPWQQRAFEDRPWLANIVAGNKFDDYMAVRYPHNEIYVDFPGNVSGRARLDSYVPGEEIISRKLTQLGEVDVSTARSYIRELGTKYPPGTTIPNTPANRASGLGGETLSGDLVLQVPPQRGRISQDLLDYAELYEVRIIDINGVEYTTWAN